MEFFDHPIECELIEEIKSIHCSYKQTFCVTKSGNVYYWKKGESDRLENICINYNIKYQIYLFLLHKRFTLYILYILYIK